MTGGGKLRPYTQTARIEVEGAQPPVVTETLWDGGLRADGYASYLGGRYRYDKKRKKKKPSTADLKMLLKAGYAIGQLRKKKREDD